MSFHHLNTQVELPVDVETAFAYHERTGALQRLLPPWESVRILSSDQSLQVGSQVRMQMRVAGIPLTWLAEHCLYDPPHRFADKAITSPFRSWFHTHRFEAIAADRCRLIDEIEYSLYGGILGDVAHRFSIEHSLKTMFRFRHRITADDLTCWATYQRQLEPMKLIVTGASGLVGSSLLPFLSTLGHYPIAAKRIGNGADTDFQVAAPENWDGCDAVIHLAGKSIADGRWTPEFKRSLRDSRVAPTQTLCKKLASLSHKPKVLLCASATGIYGDRGDETLDEQSSPGIDFLAQLADDWEQACQPARDAGIRVVHLRFGIVLSPRGGALSKLVTPAKWALGGPVGSGKQWWSWIAIDDCLGAIYHALATDSLSGPVNLTSPQPVTNQQFAKTLGHVLGRPALLPAPAPVLRLVLGEMADALLLSSCRALPRRLTETGYTFRFDNLDAALRHLLGKT